MFMGVTIWRILIFRKYDISMAVEIPCLTCPTWSHFIQDKLKISIYLSLDKYNCIKFSALDKLLGQLGTYAT